MRPSLLTSTLSAVTGVVLAVTGTVVPAEAGDGYRDFEAPI